MNILIAIGRKETITNANGKAQETSILYTKKHAVFLIDNSCYFLTLVASFPGATTNILVTNTYVCILYTKYITMPRAAAPRTTRHC
jgi:hypothetical protein